METDAAASEVSNPLTAHAFFRSVNTVPTGRS